MKNALLRLLLAVGFLAALSECRPKARPLTPQEEKVQLDQAREALVEKLTTDRENSDPEAIAAVVDGIPDDTLREWLRADSAFAAELQRYRPGADAGVPQGRSPR